jgi:integrase
MFMGLAFGARTGPAFDRFPRPQHLHFNRINGCGTNSSNERNDEMPKVKLDAAFCLTATCEPGRRKTDYWDTTIAGFVLECRSTGGRTYYLRYIDPHGRQKALKIGGYGSITHDQAQKAAKRFRSEAVLGGDPAGKKEEKKAVPLYASLAAQHVAHAKAHLRRPDGVERIVRCHLLPRWGKLRLNEIRSQDVALWLGEKADEGLAPATVEKIRVVLSRSFELAAQWSMSGTETNPVRGVPRRRFSNARERYLTAAEAARLLKAADASLNPQLKHIVRLLLLTGARVSELLHAEWRHADLERQAWLIPQSKTGKSRHVPLSRAAMDVIEQLPRFHGCPYLVPNPETRLPYVSLKHSWQTAREQAGLYDLRIHDLRHSAASFMINAGIDLYAVGKVLGHADHKSTMRYSHLANETLLAAVEAGAAKLHL